MSHQLGNSNCSGEPYPRVANVKTATSQTDPLLLPFLRATDEREEEIILASLIAEHVEPLVKQIIKHKLQFYVGSSAGDVGIEDVFFETRLNLLKRLRRLKKDPNGSVANLHSYVATATRHACDEYLRRKYPRRRHLKDQIRYQLNTDDRFSLVETAERRWIAGLTSRNEREPCSSQVELQTRVEQSLAETDVRSLTLAELLFEILSSCGQPLELDCLTDVIARLWDIEDHSDESLESDEEGYVSAQDLVARSTPDTFLEYHRRLEQVWSEICQLPRRQRVALLLNLRNPQRINVITLFPITKIATFEQIAEILEIPQAEFEQVWSQLPLDDARIGELLGATRQQVINLRRNARDRLIRRTRATNKEQDR